MTDDGARTAAPRNPSAQALEMVRSAASSAAALFAAPVCKNRDTQGSTRRISELSAGQTSRIRRS